MNFTWQNDWNYFLCCWSLEQWERHLPSECGCLSCDRMQSCQQTPTLKGTCCFHLECHSVLGEWGEELNRLQGRQSVGNKERGWGARIWLQPILTSYFWLVSYLATSLCHHSLSSLYSLWPWRWAQHLPLKWWYEPTWLHGVMVTALWKTLELT